MAETSLAQGYAEALLALARARGETSVVEAELRVISQMLRKDSGFRRALRDPDVADEHRADRVRTALKGVVGDLVAGHLATMIQHGNERLIAGMIECFLDTVSTSAERVTAEVHTVVALDGDQKARLEEVLGRRFGKTVRVQVLIDSSVLGGLLIRVGNELIDATVRARLAKMRHAMHRNVGTLAGSHV